MIEQKVNVQSNFPTTLGRKLGKHIILNVQKLSN